PPLAHKIKMASRRAKAASRGFPRVTNHESPIIGLEENLQIVVNVGRTSGANDDAASLAEPLLLAARSPQESRLHSGSSSIAGPEHRRKYCDLHPHQRLVDRKSTRLNSSHVSISYAVFCLKKKNKANIMFKKIEAIARQQPFVNPSYQTVWTS